MLFCMLLMPHRVEADGAIPVYSKALQNLMKQQEQMNQSKTVTEAAFNKMVTEYKTLLKQSPSEKARIYIQLGKMYSEMTDQQRRDYAQAVPYYNEALVALAPEDVNLRGEVLLAIAFCYYRPSSFHDIDKAREYFIKASEINRAYAVQLARMSLFAWGGPCDYFLACCLYDIATRDGWEGGMENYSYLMHVLDLDAAGRLDTMHLAGLEKGYFYRVVADQQARSLTTMILTAELGFATAEFEMGLIYGETEFQNIDEAFRWYRLASDHGYDPAMAKLAQLCLAHTLDTASGNIFERQANGKYAPQIYDRVYEECERLLMTPAQHGFAQAQLYLGQMYKNGCVNGTIKHNYRKAYYWLLLARTNGMTDAIAELEELDKTVDNASDQLLVSDYQSIFMKVKEDARKNDIASTCLTRIVHSNQWGKPFLMNSTYYTIPMLGDKKIPMPKKNEIEPMMAKYYQQTYGLYISILKNMSRDHMIYSDHERKHYQSMMIRLRSRSEIVCPSAEIKASPWESWDGR